MFWVSQSSDVDGDRLGRAFATLVDGSALGEASRERGYQNHVAAGFLRLEHDCVSPHECILSTQTRGEILSIPDRGQSAPGIIP